MYVTTVTRSAPIILLWHFLSTSLDNSFPQIKHRSDHKADVHSLEAHISY